MKAFGSRAGRSRRRAATERRFHRANSANSAEFARGGGGRESKRGLYRSWTRRGRCGNRPSMWWLHPKRLGLSRQAPELDHRSGAHHEFARRIRANSSGALCESTLVEMCVEACRVWEWKPFMSSFRGAIKRRMPRSWRLMVCDGAPANSGGEVFLPYIM